MTFYAPSDPQALHAAPGDWDDSKNDRDDPMDPPITGDLDGDPFPSSPPDFDRRERSYNQEIHGDERGGQVPKRPGR